MAVRRKCIGCYHPYDFVVGTVYICPYCGTEQNPGLSADLADLLTSALTFRRNKQFNKSVNEYKRILESNSEIGEAHFGIFLCDYEITSEEDLLKNPNYSFDSSSKIPVEDNENYQNALLYAGRNRNYWEEIGQKVEQFRQTNKKIKTAIKQNCYKVALVCDEAVSEDLSLANSIFNSTRSRVDIFYPPETLKNISDSMKDKATRLALENVDLLFIVCSHNSRKSSYLKNCFEKFIENHDAYAVSVITDDEDFIPTGIEYDEDIISCDSESADKVISQVRIMANLTLDERNNLREGLSCVKNESCPSPIL